MSQNITIVTPIPKVPNAKKAEEFRPINNLPVIEKIIESVVKNQLVDYLDEFDIICKEPSGFRTKHSTESALNSTLADWMEDSEKNKSIVAVFLDFKWAFETVNRNILLRKMHRYGFSESAMQWFQNYLNERKQTTKIGEAESSPKNVEIGLPQGTKLSNLLFKPCLFMISKWFWMMES